MNTQDRLLVSGVAELRATMQGLAGLLREAKERCSQQSPAEAEFYHWVTDWYDRLATQALLTSTDADSVWRLARKQLAAQTELTAEQSMHLTSALGAASAEAIEESVAGAIAAVDGMRRANFEAAIRVVTESGVMGASETDAIARLAKAGIKDAMRMSNTFEELLRLLFNFDVDRQVWDRVAGPARATLAVNLLERGSLVVSVTSGFAKSAMAFAMATTAK